MAVQKLKFKYRFSRREPKLTESVKAAARKTVGDVTFTAGPKAPKRRRNGTNLGTLTVRTAHRAPDGKLMPRHMARPTSPIFLLIAFVLLAGVAFAQATSRATFTGVRVAVAPPTTATPSDLASPLWQRALHVHDFTNYTTRGEPENRTDAYLLFGPDAVYCAFVAQQRSVPIIATQLTNNLGFGLDDHVAVMLETSGNGTNQYYFETTPAAIRYQQASESTRYAPAWRAIAHTDGRTWMAELIIPYRFLRGSGKAWRINFTRYVAQRQDTYTWAYEPQMSNPQAVSEWPTLTNAPPIAARTPAPTAQIYALGASGRDGNVFEGSAGEFDSARSRNIGIDAKIPITPTLNFDGAINPDFSNVENDQQTISPQEFRYQYAEYRPFFTQGANDLPGTDIFYSPSIGVFDHGEKLEGQIGQVAVGVLNVGTFGSSDRAYRVGYAAPNQELSISVSGAQASRANGDDAVVEVGATDTNIFSHVQFGGGAALESRHFTSDSTQASDLYAFAGINRANYSLSANYYDVGPRYRPVDGYIPQSDLRGYQIGGSLSSTQNPTTLIRKLALSGSADRYIDGSGQVRLGDSELTGNVTFKNLLAITLDSSLSSLRNYHVAYPIYADGITLPYNQSSISASYRAGMPNTVSGSYAWGMYATYYLQQLSVSVSHQFSHRVSGEIDYGDVEERAVNESPVSQILRRFSLVDALSPDATLNVAYRAVSGAGGFSTPGHNFALGYSRRFGKGSTLNAEFGSPAATHTLDRYVIKYVLLIGSGAGE